MKLIVIMMDVIAEINVVNKLLFNEEYVKVKSTKFMGTVIETYKVKKCDRNGK